MSFRYSALYPTITDSLYIIDSIKILTDYVLFSLLAAYNILLVKKNDFFQSEKIGAKFYDFVKSNEVNEVLILGSNFPLVTQSIKFDSFFITSKKSR